MSNLIAFLESLGRDAAAPTQGEAFATAVKAAGLDDQAEAALLSGDVGALNDLLGGRKQMLCSLFPADDDEKQPDEQPADDEPDEKSPSVGLH